MSKRVCTECDKCKQLITNNNYKKHYPGCDGSVNYWSKVRKGEVIPRDEVICRFCAKTSKNARSRRSHERLCELNNERQLTPFQTHQLLIQQAKLATECSNQFIKARKLGLPVPAVSTETKQKISEKIKIASNKYWTDPANRKQKSEKMSVIVANKMADGTWHTHGHYKKIEYKGIVFDSSWEVKYAQWLDANSITWERCRRNFEYVFEDKLKRYTPDFYLPLSDEYIEIKGYITDKDNAKWTQFPSNCKLVVLMGDDLKKINVL